MEAKLDSGLSSNIKSFVSQFSDYTFAGHPVSAHITRFLDIISRLVAYLDSRSVAGLEDLTLAIDTLDYFSSTSKWWNIDRRTPSFLLKPPAQDPRELMASLATITVGSGTMSRITGSIERLARFLEEHNFTNQESCDVLSESLASMWVLLSAFACKGLGRTATAEGDFEIAYDVVRILLFHSTRNNYGALTAIRLLGMSDSLTKSATITLSPSFEDRLESSIAAALENVHQEKTDTPAHRLSASLRHVFTNSLRLLSQLEAFRRNINRAESSDYSLLIRGALKRLQMVNVDDSILHEEAPALAFFKYIVPSDELTQRIELMARRLEEYIVGYTGNRDFLFKYSKLVPRLLSLILLLAGGTIDRSRKIIEYNDVERAIIMLHSIFNLPG
jgi:hypothetical protein